MNREEAIKIISDTLDVDIRMAERVMRKLDKLGYRFVPELKVLEDEEQFATFEFEYAKKLKLPFPLGGEERDRCNREAQRDYDQKQIAEGKK